MGGTTFSFTHKISEQRYRMETTKQQTSDLENGITTIIQVFQKYSGEKRKLSKVELKELINNEMSLFILKIQDKDILDELFDELDQDKDQAIDFKEFLALVAMVTSACHEFANPNIHD